MKNVRRSMIISLVPALSFLSSFKHGNPYIDPGTGSIVIQAVIGGFTAAVVAVGLFWKQINAFLRNLLSRSKKSEEPKE